MGQRREARGERKEDGTALIGALAVALILSMLGTLSLNLGVHELQSAAAVRDEAAAQHLAEAGSELVVQWFHDPQSAPVAAVASTPPSASGWTAGSLFGKRYDLPQSGPSFFDANGMSQFAGTADRPDFVYDATKPEDDRLLNDLTSGWFRSLRAIGRLLKLKVYGPTRPGLLCTVEITAGTASAASGGQSGLAKTVSVQLGTRTIPPLRAGVQIGVSEVNQPSQRQDAALPVWVHWGDLKIKRDARLGKSTDIPTKSAMAPVTGQSYAEMARREDRWLDIFVGGEALFDDIPSALASLPPPHIYARRDPFPGLHEDRWAYETLKQHALLYGSYYARGRDGLLYQNGLVQPGLGRTASEVFGSEAVGDHHGLVFVDTLDQGPPRADNLGTLTLETSYAEGLFIVYANVALKPTGLGKSVPALSPPEEGSSSLGSRIPVELTGIHVNGVLYVAGDLTFEGQPRLYGGLVTGGTVSGVPGTTHPIEVWYDHDFRSGLVRGMPLVYVVPGTWQEKY